MPLLANVYKKQTFVLVARPDGLQNYTIPIGRHDEEPFSISMDVKRSLKAAYISYMAVDHVRLVNCQPGQTDLS